jgi:hypothetical protein
MKCEPVGKCPTLPLEGKTYLQGRGFLPQRFHLGLGLLLLVFQRPDSLHGLADLGAECLLLKSRGTGPPQR